MASLASMFVLFGQAAAQAAAPPTEFHQEPWFRLVVAVGIVAVSWALGVWLSKVWRMPDYSFRFGIILFALIAGIVICLWSWPPKLGIDLKGGVILIYEVAEEQEQTISLTEPIDRIRNYLADRVEATTQVAAQGNNRIAISVPTTDAETLDKIEEVVKGINFRTFTVGNAQRETRGGGATIVFDVKSTEAAGAVNMDELVAALNRRVNPGGQKEVVIRKFGDRQVEIIIPEANPAEIDLIKDKISTAGLLEFRIVANDRDHQSVIEAAQRNRLAREVIQDGRVVAKWVKLDKAEMRSVGRMPTRENQDGEIEALVVMDDYNVTGGHLANASRGYDEFGQPAVNFSFDSRGSILFGALTGENVPDPATGFKRELAIVLDGRLMSAPELRSAISSNGQITGNFTDEQVKFLVEILNAGRLPAALDKVPISQTNISPQLGADTIQRGRNAMIFSTLAILVFMVVYYRFSGLVADFAVLVNILLVVALMITLGAAFTLAGLAGLVLSVGMAVDANVLIYERMREELQRGSALRMAIRNGFGRAMSTIIDSNLTTLLTGVVLYAIGTDQLKGFAITLILGLLLNLFTAVYVARVIFDVAERRRWITELKMMKMFDVPNWDFVRPTKYALTLSAIVIIIGLIAARSRGSGLFDIDFTGGTSVQVVLKDDARMDVAEVRRIVSAENSENRLEDVTVSSVGTPGSDDVDRIYKIDTSLQQIDEVERRLQALFKDKLQVYQMTYAAPVAILGATTSSGSASPDVRTKTDDTKGELKSPPSKTEKQADDPSKETKEDRGAPDNADSDKKDASTADDKAATDAPGADDAKKESTDNDASSDKDADAKSKADEAKQASAAVLPVNLLRLTGVDALLLLQDDEKKADPPEGKQKADDVPAAAQKEDAVGKSSDDAADTEPSKDGASKASDAKSTRAAEDAKTAVDKNAADSKVNRFTSDDLKNLSSKGAGAALPTRKSGAAERAEADADLFAGGSSAKLQFKEGINRTALLAKLEAAAAALKLQPAQFQLEDPERSTSSRIFNEWTVRTNLPPDQAAAALEHVQNDLAQTPIFRAANNIGGKIAGRTKVMAVYAMLASMVMIVVYVWVRFQNIVFGLAAVVALVHDVLVTIAALAVSYYVAPFLGWAMVDPFKISLDVVAALLTIVGFSINDTIVIFDRIREIKGKSPEITADMVNKAVNQTLGRTILTSGTVLVVTIILYVWGGQEIHPFAFAMLVGLISGTYSTVYIASPLVLWLRKPGAAASRARMYGERAVERV
jgi:SecD/SecF fusion protein